MSRSIAFEKIRSDVLGETASVPLGRVTTYALIGDRTQIRRHRSCFRKKARGLKQRFRPQFVGNSSPAWNLSAGASGRDDAIHGHGI
jgi:hypothetical protein